MSLSDYERRALEEVEGYFRGADEGLLGQVSRRLFKPVEMLGERLIPERVVTAAGQGVEAVLRRLHRLSDQTVDVGVVLEQLRGEEGGIEGLEDVFGVDLRGLDRVAEAITDRHETLATLEGAGCGAGGAALLAADIPLLFGVALRVVRLISVCYGVDPHAPGEEVIAFKVFELACGGTRDRYAELLEVETLRDELDGLDPAQRAEKAAVLAGVFMSREAVKRIVSLLLSRKLFQTVPVAGALVGAGFNYLFVSGVAEAARQAYRRRYLRDKQRRLAG